MKKIAAKLAICLAVISLQGCASWAEYLIYHDRRDAPWDPPRGRLMFEQLPNGYQQGKDHR